MNRDSNAAVYIQKVAGKAITVICFTERTFACFACSKIRS